MNVISSAKVKALREELERGTSIRKSARLVGVNRNTAYRWYKIFNFQNREIPRTHTITIKVSETAKARLATEAKTMALTPTIFAGLLLETIAEDDLFGAVLDA